MVENKIKEIEDLIKIISKLPGLGKKSSSRIVLKLINNREELMKNLTNALALPISTLYAAKFVVT